MKQRYSFLFVFFIIATFITPPIQAQNNSNQSNVNLFRPPDVPTPNRYRSSNGAPGPAYWQNSASYDIEVTLYPEDHRIEGSETIIYTNNSPENLEYLWLQLDQNLFKPTSIGARITDLSQRF